MKTNAEKKHATNKIIDVNFTKDTLHFALADGREISAPLEWFPRLCDASDSDRHNWRLIGNGIGVNWPKIDEDISIRNQYKRVLNKVNTMNKPLSTFERKMKNSKFRKAFEDGYNKKGYLYPASITHDKTDGRYFVKFFDLEEAFTEGESLEDALFNASQVLTLTLEARINENMDIPKPSIPKTNDTYLIAPSATEKTPNLETQQAIAEAEAGKGKEFESAKALMDDLNADD